MASHSLEKIFLVLITVIVVTIVAASQLDIIKTNTDKLSGTNSNFMSKLKIKVINPPEGGYLTFNYPVTWNGKDYYGAKITFYSTIKVENDKIPIKLSGIEVDHIIIADEKQVVYNDGKIRYNYMYTAWILIDPDKFKKEVSYQDNETVLFVGDDKSLNQVAYFTIKETHSNTPISLSGLSQPKLYVYLYFDQASGEYKILKVVKEDKSATQPTVIIVNNDSSNAPSIGSVTIDSDTYQPADDSSTNTYVSSTSNPQYGDTVSVTLYDQNGNVIGSNPSAQVISGTDSDGDGVIDQPTAQPDERNFYIDGSFVLHYRILNYDPNNPADIQITDPSATTKKRWILVEIKDYQGNDKTSAETTYNNGTGTPTQTISIDQLIGRITTQNVENGTPVKDSNNVTVGYILNPNGYIDESADLSQWLDDDKYHILNITFYINGYLWDTKNNQQSDQPYQLVLSYRYDLDNTNRGDTSTSTSDSTTQSTTTTSGSTVNYLIIYAQNTLGNSYTLWENPQIFTVFRLREGDNVRGFETPIDYDFNSQWLGVDSGNGYDYGIYTTTNDQNYQSVVRQANVGDTTLDDGETLVMKVDSQQVPYGIYYLNITTSDGKYLLTKYFLWDGTGIYWMDVSSSVGNYYDTQFPYKKEYSIQYSGDTVFGYQVLTYIIFTDDSSVDPYIANVTFSESDLNTDLNNDGDTADTVVGTLFGQKMFNALMHDVNQEPAWKTSDVWIRYTYYEPGLGEMEIPFYIENVTGPHTTTINGTQYDVYVAKIYIKVPVIRDSSKNDNNGGYVYWNG